MADASVTFGPVGSGDGEALATLRVEAMRPSLERVGRFNADRARARFLNSFSPEYTREVVLGGLRVGFFVLRPQSGGLLLAVACVALGACTSLPPLASNRLGMQMVLVPAGEFTMGNDASVQEMSKLFPQYELRRLQDLADETPAHRVRITRPFYMARHDESPRDSWRPVGLSQAATAVS